jgi:hypothetical protein
MEFSAASCHSISDRCTYSRKHTEGAHWIHLAQDRDHLQLYMNWQSAFEFTSTLIIARILCCGRHICKSNIVPLTVNGYMTSLLINSLRPFTRIVKFPFRYVTYSV